MSNTKKYKFQVMVALTYEDKDIEVEVDLSNEEVTKIKELVSKSIELQKGLFGDDEFTYERDLLMILESGASELFDKFWWDTIYPRVFIKMLVNGIENGYIEKYDEDDFDYDNEDDFDDIQDMYSDDIDLECSECCICRIPEAWKTK